MPARTRNAIAPGSNNNGEADPAVGASGGATGGPPENQRATTGEDTGASSTDEFSEAGRQQDALEEWKALGGDDVRNSLTIYAVNETGGSEFLDTVALLPPETVMRMVRERWGKGVYRFQPRENGRIGKSFTLSIADDSRRVDLVTPLPTAPSPVAVVASAPGAVDVEKLLAGMMTMFERRDAAAALERREQAIENREHQLNLVKEMQKVSAPASSDRFDKLIDGLLANALKPAPPPPPPPTLKDMLAEHAALAKLVDRGGNDGSSLIDGLMALAPLATGFMQAIAPRARRAPPGGGVASVTPVPTPGPVVPPAGAEIEAEEVEEEEQTEAGQLDQVVAVIESMAARKVATADALTTIRALTDPSQLDKLCAWITRPNAVSLLMVMAPTLAPHRAWIDELVLELAKKPAAGAADGQA